MNQKIEYPVNNPDGMGMAELLRLLTKSWRWLVAGAAFGVLGAFVFILVVDEQYEANAVIQPATVGISSSTNTTTKGTDVESAAQTLERLKLSGFYNDEILNACKLAGIANSRQTIIKKIKPVLIKGNSLVQISYVADSPQIAESCLAAVVNQLTKAQSQIAEPIIKTLEEQRVLTKKQLVDVEKIQAQIENRAMTLDRSDTTTNPSMLMLGAALSKREEIAKLTKVYNEQSLLLTEPMTQQVKLLEAIYASENPVYPKKMLVVLVALILGIMSGALIFFAHGTLQDIKKYTRSLNETKSGNLPLS